MGLSVLKWVYELGVKHERHRIASYLKLQERMAFRAQADAYDELKAQHMPPKSKQAKEWELAVNGAVEDIIRGLFTESHGEYVPGESIMFPKGEKK